MPSDNHFTFRGSRHGLETRSTYDALRRCAVKSRDRAPGVPAFPACKAGDPPPGARRSTAKASRRHTAAHRGPVVAASKHERKTS